MKKEKIIGIILTILIIVIFGIFKLIENTKNDFEYLNNSDIITKENSTEEIVEEESIKIHIAGEVINTGIIELKEGDRIADAIEKAGGITMNADLSKVNLAYVLEDGQKLYIPNFKDSKDIEYVSNQNGEDIIENPINSATSGKVNINKATKEQLETIQGIGPALAQRIVDYREQNGKFKNIEDIKNVSGIGDKKYEGLKDHIEIK